MQDMNWIVSDSGTITVFAAGKSYNFAKDHHFYLEAKKALFDKNLDAIQKYHDMSKTVENWTDGNVEVKDGVVYYKQKALREKFSARIIALMVQKLPFYPMLRFLENLMENPSMRAVDELYDFLSHRALPITDDGCFLAYKRVNDDWKDFKTQTFDNSIGKVVKMTRNEVDDNRDLGCSSGLHVGSIEFVNGFNAGTGHVVVVKINPKDVVSVPVEYDCTKLRCCEYLVIDEYKGDLTSSVCSSANPYADDPIFSGQSDDDWEEQEDSWDEEDDDEENENQVWNRNFPQ